MKKYVMLLLTLVITATAFSQQMPQLSQEDKKQAIDMIVALFSKPIPSKIIVPDVLAEKPLPKNLTIADFDKQLLPFTNSLYFKISDFHDNEAKIEADNFMFPNGDLVKANYKWTKCLAKDGSTLEMLAKNEEPKLSTLDFMSDVVAFKPQEGKILTTIDGILKINYPTEFKQISFAKTDVGKEQMVEGVTVKLLSIENDIALFQITYQENKRESNLTYYALNSKGEPLFLEISRSEIPKSAYDAIGADGKISEIKKKDLLDRFDNIGQHDPIIGYIKAIGTIAQLVVVAPQKFILRDIPVKALKVPDFAHDELNVARERYENIPLNVHYDKITETDLAKSSLKTTRSEEMFGFNNHKLIFTLPNSNNSAYAQVDFKDVVATKGGKKVEFEPQGPFYDEKTKTISFRLEPTSGNNPIECDEIKGTIAVKYPSEIVIQKIAVTQKSENFEMKNPNKIRFFEKEEALKGEGGTKPTRAYAANGLPLKRVEGVFISGSENDKSYVEYIYWGKVAMIQMDNATQWITKEMPFILKPAPKLQKKNSF